MAKPLPKPNKKITASALRQNVYRLLDRVIKTGRPLQVERRGVLLTINPQQKKDKLSGLKKRHVYDCDPEEFVHLDWSHEWKPGSF